MSMSLKKLLLGSILLLATGCGEEYGIEYGIFIDPAFPVEDQQAAALAAGAWDDALGKNIRLSTYIGKCEASDFALFTSKRMICIQPCSVEWINRQTDEYAVGATIRKGDNDSANVYIPV